jgi:serine/threonine protein kinase
LNILNYNHNDIDQNVNTKKEQKGIRQEPILNYLQIQNKEKDMTNDYNKNMLKEQKKYPNKISNGCNILYRYEKKELGSGSNGTVYKGIKVNDSGPDHEMGNVAIKIQLKTGGVIEGKYLHKLNSPNSNENIIKWIETIPNCNQYKETCNIMEYCSGNTLENFLEKKFDDKDTYEQILQNIFFQIVQGVQYKNEKNIIHGDIKPANILLKTNVCDVDSVDIKLTDFGLSFSSDIEWESNRMYKTTPLIQAPETAKSGISKETDIWAIGVVLYNILFNQWPWNSKGCSNVIEKICNNDLYFPDKAKHFPDAKDLITKILQKNPKERYTIHQILDHKFNV